MPVVFSSCMSSTSAGEIGADRNQLLLISESEIEASAKQSYDQVIADAQAAGTLNKDAATVKRVQDVAKKLIAQTATFRSDAAGWNWEVNVITDKTVNAWCMPGGKIVVYTGIIDSLQLTDAQIAVVMGHEISHALREHSREQMSRATVTSIGASAISSIARLGETGNALLSVATEYLITLPFSRSQETEADNVGIELMSRAGYDPHEAVKVWEKMAALSSSSTPEIMSTHPSNESRIANLKVLAEKVYPLYLDTIK